MEIEKWQFRAYERVTATGITDIDQIAELARLDRIVVQEIDKQYEELIQKFPDVGKMFRVRFSDGFEYDVCDDELMKSPRDFYRPLII